MPSSYSVGAAPHSAFPPDNTPHPGAHFQAGGHSPKRASLGYKREHSSEGEREGSPLKLKRPALEEHVDHVQLSYASPPASPAPSASSFSSVSSADMRLLGDVDRALGQKLLGILDDLMKNGNAYPSDTGGSAPMPQSGIPSPQDITTRQRRPVPPQQVKLNRKMILDMKERLSSLPRITIRKLAKEYGLAERTVRAFVWGTGHQTSLGMDIDKGEIVLPADREAAGLPPAEPKYTLTVAEFGFAGKYIGHTTGKLPRKLFAGIFDYDVAVICKYFTGEGYLTPLGHQALEKALQQEALENKTAQEQVTSEEAARKTPIKSYTEAAASPQNHTAPPADTNLTHIASYTDNDQIALEQRLEQFAIRYDFTISLWHNGKYRRLGHSGARFMGYVDKTTGYWRDLKIEYWRICPVLGGEYRLIADQHPMEHIVNILLLDEGRRSVSIRTRYDVARAGGKNTYVLTPKHGGPCLPIPPLRSDKRS